MRVHVCDCPTAVSSVSVCPSVFSVSLAYVCVCVCVCVLECVCINSS